MNTILDKQWSEDMGEISGFGGGYEAVCRAMVLAGIRWIDEHPDADLHFEASPQIFGVAIEKGHDAILLTAAMMDAPVYHDGKLLHEHVKQDCTGAMHHAAINHVLAYKRLGWVEYQRQLRERDHAEKG